METSAILRGVRLSAQKGRLVADQIRGLAVDKALNVLAFSPKKGAKIIKACSSRRSPMPSTTTAPTSTSSKSDHLCRQGDEPARFTARAKGRGNVILKQTCHIHLTVGDGKKGYVMGQKIHPTGFRLSVNRNWSSQVVREQKTSRPC